MSRISLVGIAEIDPQLLDGLRAFVARTFMVDVEVWPPRDDLDPAPDPARGQVLSTEVLRRLLRLVPVGSDRLIGLTERDLFLPTLTFVFGHAQLEGQVAAVSLYRLRQENVGLGADPELLWSRVTREVAHELGHTYGLRHCARRSCCMSLSTSIEEVDAKSDDFCRSCRALLRESQRRERIRSERGCTAPDSCEEMKP